MFNISVGEYVVGCQLDGLPDQLPDYQKRALLSEDFAVTGSEYSSSCFVSVARLVQWPFLVVTQRYAPSQGGFDPGALLVPETSRLFIGAGRRLLAYDLSTPARLWEDETDCGFWSWSQHGAVVLMAAELELAAWDIHGVKLWSIFVEPPWEYKVSGEIVTLDVMGTISRLQLRSGVPV